jgi:hypothetical protein
MRKYWIGVASREHVLCGISDGIAQVCHGKAGPLKQMSAGDWLVYYSPTERFQQKEPCRRFTAIGKIRSGQPYQYRMSEDFVPWRIDVDFVEAQEASIEPLIDSLSFILDKRRWGYPFRRGCFSIPACDFYLIANTMLLNKSMVSDGSFG